MKIPTNPNGIKTNLVLVDGIWAKYIGDTEYRYWIGDEPEFDYCFVYQALDGNLFGYDNGFIDIINVNVKGIVTDKMYYAKKKRGQHSNSNNKKKARCARYKKAMEEARNNHEDDDLPF